MRASLLRAAAFIGALLIPVGATAATLGADRLLVFGDSLSDTGNAFRLSGGDVPASPPNFDGRFSEGPIWIDGIADDFAAEGRPVHNYAVGGAVAVGALQAQIAAHALSGRGPGEAGAAAIFIGGNDLKTIADNRRPGLLARAAADEAARLAARSVGSGARALAGQGIERFLIFNAPNLADVPYYSLNRPDRAGYARRATDQFNATLERVVRDLQGGGLEVAAIDVNGLFAAARANPGAFGLSNVSEPCLSGAGACANPASYLFWDNQHPTSAGHAILADLVRGAIEPIAAAPPATSAEVQPVPLPAPALLLLAGLAGLGLLSRRARS